MTVLLGLGSALFIGLADVLVSFVVRRSSVLASATWNFVLGAPLTLALALMFSGTLSAEGLLFGSLAGACAGFALLFLLGGYARTEIGVVGPIAGVIGAAIPIAASIAADGLPSAPVMLGLVAGVLAVALVAVSKTGPDEPPAFGAQAAQRPAQAGTATKIVRVGIAMAVGAGVLYGLTAVLLSKVDGDAGIWPAVMVRAVGAVCLLGVAAQRREPLRQNRPNAARLLASAAFAAVGMGCFALTAQRDVAIAGLLVQMAYAVSVVGAAILYRERANGIQITGFAIAALSVVLISLS